MSLSFLISKYYFYRHLSFSCGGSLSCFVQAFLKQWKNILGAFFFHLCYYDCLFFFVLNIKHITSINLRLLLFFLRCHFNSVLSFSCSLEAFPFQKEDFHSWPATFSYNQWTCCWCWADQQAIRQKSTHY